MTIIQKKEDLPLLSGGNQLCGCIPELDCSEIQFRGENNILYCEEGVKLLDTSLKFMSDNSIIYLGKNRHIYRLNISIYNDCVFHMGRDNYINTNITAILSGQKHCYIGDNCIFSLGIWIRNSDAHLIYSCETGKRINHAKSIFIGDHVWIGQDVTILKGTRIDSGSIIGAGSVVAGKYIPHNQSWAGNPCRKLSEGIFWDGILTHAWTDERISISHDYSDYILKYKEDCSPDYWIYQYMEDETIEYFDLDKLLSRKNSAADKLNVLLELEENKKKNRFVH